MSIPAAFLVAGLVGVLIERGIVRFLYGRPLETLLATFGVSLILQQLVRDVFSPNNRPVETPPWMAGSLRFNDVLAITYSRLYIILFTLVVFALLLLVLKRTRLGLRGARRVAEPRHGEGHGHPHRMGGRDDLRPGLGHRRRGGRGAQPADQRRSESRADPTSSIHSWWWCLAASAVCGAR